MVIERLAPGATLRAAQGELAPWIEATPAGRDDFAGRRTHRTGGLVARSPTCRALIQHPLILATTQQLLAGATSFQLHLTQLIDLLRLIGYQRGAYALGYVDDVRDPLEVLRGSRAADSDAGRLGDLERAAAQLRRTR